MDKEKVDYLLDTNIIIYLSKGSVQARNLLMNLESQLGVSVITSLEFMMGFKESEEVKGEKFISKFRIVPFNFPIARRVEYYLKASNNRNIKHAKLPDIIIGATAEELKIPLITNNPKDFAIFKNLEIVSVK